MVLGGGQGADTEVTSGKTTSDISGQETLSVTSVVDTLEEGELGWVRRSGGVERVTQILNSDVGVSDNLALAVELLRSSVVGGIGVGESTSLQILSLNSDCEVLLGLDVVAVLGECENRGDHGVLGGNVTCILLGNPML